MRTGWTQEKLVTGGKEIIIVAVHFRLCMSHIEDSLNYLADCLLLIGVTNKFKVSLNCDRNCYILCHTIHCSVMFQNGKKTILE